MQCLKTVTRPSNLMEIFNKFACGYFYNPHPKTQSTHTHTHTKKNLLKKGRKKWFFFCWLYGAHEERWICAVANWIHCGLLNITCRWQDGWNEEQKNNQKKKTQEKNTTAIFWVTLARKCGRLNLLRGGQWSRNTGEWKELREWVARARERKR